ncbi:alpha/beta fold hydrolase [Mycobacterium shimoidei]|uniref:alpha/beta fold hydrolase n=1 Tax=Mycobacterium shimoidei TaxID=29313 RepID=UPI000848FA6B|nr:alpha/beta fold hydrolase [Mycobacterium shimoidei]MCV7259363.1 alpha/beta fold hydrolase [Mycobacterium shimoidei]ODR14755.1 alpha/beta hydrolase [Mycobacterium shimoidei]ORW81120.1 alpha/beta hydrolase [Mycobacterium shimoidei]
MTAAQVTYEETIREIATEPGVLRYHEAGDGPPLVLLHGSGPGVTGWRNFRGVLGTFSEFFRCLVLEFPGFGVSDDFGGHPMITAFDAVTRFLDALDLDTVDIIGNSMGGGVALNVAMSQPDRVRRLVTIGGIGRNVFSPGPPEGIRLLQEFTEEPSRERLIRWLHSMVYDPAVITDELIEERWAHATDPATLASARRMYSKEAFEQMIKAMESSNGPQPWAMMHRIKAPTLITWGRDDRVSPLDMALIPMRTIPNAELHVFPNCGHWTMIEAKEAFENVVSAFLLRRESATGDGSTREMRQQLHSRG